MNNLMDDLKDIFGEIQELEKEIAEMQKERDKLIQVQLVMLAMAIVNKK